MAGDSTGAASVGKALSLMIDLVGDGGVTPASRIAGELQLPPSSARRLIAAMVSAGLLMRVDHGHYAAGPALENLSGMVTLEARMVAAARAPLRRLARSTGAAAHLGVLEGEMVTYLAKQGSTAEFGGTKVGTQLEAYCTGIGKMLLACLPDAERDHFLRSGSFIPITASTITDPEILREQLIEAERLGYARDEAEMFEGLRCTAVAVMRRGVPIGAISLSRQGATADARRIESDVNHLRTCASEISQVFDNDG